MAKLVYYYAERLDDSDCYSIVSRTLKGAREMLKTRTHGEFGPIQKKELVYRDAFDMFTWIASEAGGHGAGKTLKEYA